MRKMEIGCSWAGHCACGKRTIEADSFDAFIAGLEKFFEDMCGMSGVDSFYVLCGDEEFDWDNEDLSRNKDLSNVWKSVKKELNDFFNACN